MVESMITFEEEDQGYFEVKVRGPLENGVQCFALLNIIMDAIDCTTDAVAPGILLEKHWLSSTQLQDYDEVMILWGCIDVGKVGLEI